MEKLTIWKWAKLGVHAPQFLTEKRNIFHFLILVSIFEVLFLTIYKPMGLLHTSESLSQWSPIFYMVILAASGLAVLIGSRVLLYHRQKRKPLKSNEYLIWVIAEVVLFTLLLSTLAYCINANKELHFLSILWRAFLDIVTVLLIPYIISILIFLLREQRQEIAALNAMILEERQPATVPDEMINFYDKGGRLAFATKKKNVLYVEASDNYTNIHYVNEDKVDCFILHCSMKQMEQEYAKDGMLRCHRGYLVNIANVKLLRKEKDGLAIELAQTDKIIPVSKTYVEKVAHCFASSPNTRERA